MGTGIVKHRQSGSHSASHCSVAVDDMLCKPPGASCVGKAMSCEQHGVGTVVQTCTSHVWCELCVTDMVCKLCGASYVTQAM
eukprot:9499845-Pyramimonas_sp.AAC.1